MNWCLLFKCDHKLKLVEAQDESAYWEKRFYEKFDAQESNWISLLESKDKTHRESIIHMRKELKSIIELYEGLLNKALAPKFWGENKE